MTEPGSSADDDRGEVTIMSTMTHGHADHGVVSTVARAVTGVRITVPASAKMRDAALAEYVSAMGFDLDDDDRADKVRARRS